MANLNNLRSAANIQHDNRNLHDVPKNYYYHDKCEAPGPTCSTCGYKRGHDYYKAMEEEWAKTEDAQVADGQWYTPPNKDIECGDEFTGFVKLTSNLICPNDELRGIVLNGPNAFLDCDDFFISGTGGDMTSSIGIYLQNGATAINCHVFGFDAGVFMEEGNNVLKDSTVARSIKANIATDGEGCMTVDNVLSEGALGDDGDFGDGIDIGHKGDMNIYDSVSTGNFDDGVDVFGEGLCFYAENVKANLNGDNGFFIEHEDGATYLKMVTANSNGDDGIRVDPGGTSVGISEDVILEDVVTLNNGGDGISLVDLKTANLYGTITSQVNDDGLRITCNEDDFECTVNVLGGVTLEGNEKGLAFGGPTDNTISFNVERCASVQACANEVDGVGGDILVNDITATIDGDITCENIFDEDGELEPDGFACERGCTAEVGKGTICQSPVHAYCYPKPEDW